MLTTIRSDPQTESCEAGGLLRKVELETPSGLMFRHKPLTHNPQMTLEGLVQTHLSDTVNPVAVSPIFPHVLGQLHYVALIGPFTSVSICFLGFC